MRRRKGPEKGRGEKNEGTGGEILCCRGVRRIGVDRRD